LDFLPNTNLVRYRFILMGSDVFAAVMSLLIVTLFSPTALVNQSLWQYVFVPSVVIASSIVGLYAPDLDRYQSRLWRAFVAAIGVGCVGWLTFFNAYSAGWLLFCVSVFFVLQQLGHGLFLKLRRSCWHRKNVLIFGTGIKARKIEQILRLYVNDYHLVGYIQTAGDRKYIDAEQVVGRVDDLSTVVQTLPVHMIVIALTERRGHLPVKQLLNCKLQGIEIVDYPAFFETLVGKIPVEDLEPSWLVQSKGLLITPTMRLLKRAIDIVLASILLVVVAPILMPVALLVKITSPGPVLYCQKRVGLNGQIFTIYKFRSMVVNAERGQGAIWAQENDPRITRFGHFIRKTRIDELPQLFNVFKGDMSFIGPRPERPELVAEIEKTVPYYQERHIVKPGITGWAQIMYPYGASIGDALEKLRYDLYYIKNLSVLLELVIVLETINVMLFRQGSR
jgi:sugar transferase (PEP-CTERM system associated)